MRCSGTFTNAKTSSQQSKLTIMKNFVFILFSLLRVVWAFTPLPLGEQHACTMDQPDGAKICEVDHYVGSTVIYEDELVRVWNFTLAPGQMTSMHRHDTNYHFVAIKPSQLEVWGENGSVLFNFRAEGTLGFKIEGDNLVPVSHNVQLPWVVPRTHAAKNIGPTEYNEILFESKVQTSLIQLL